MYLPRDRKGWVGEKGGCLKLNKLSMKMWGTNWCSFWISVRLISLDFHDVCDYRFPHIFLNFRVLSWSVGIRFKRFFSWDPQIWAFHLRSQVSSSDHYCSASLWNHFQIGVPTSKNLGCEAALVPQKLYVCVGKANKTNSVWSVLQSSLNVSDLCGTHVGSET